MLPYKFGNRSQLLIQFMCLLMAQVDAAQRYGKKMQFNIAEIPEIHLQIRPHPLTAIKTEWSGCSTLKKIMSIDRGLLRCAQN